MATIKVYKKKRGEDPIEASPISTSKSYNTNPFDPEDTVININENQSYQLKSPLLAPEAHDLEKQLTKDKYKEVNTIHSEMQDIRQMMNEMQTHVVSQQNKLDLITSNVLDMAGTTNLGVQQLDVTRKYQRKKTKRIIFLIVFAVFLIISIGMFLSKIFQ